MPDAAAAQTEGVRVPSVLAALLLAMVAACAPAGPVAVPTPPPSSAPAPAPASPAQAARVLPPVQDVTGLRGDRLVAPPRVALPGAQADGTARLAAGGRTYLLAPARRVAPGQRPALVLVLPAANTTLREEYDRYGLDALRDHGMTVAVVGTHAASWNAGACCGRAAAEQVDDVAVVAAVRDDVVARGAARGQHVAAVGHSVGALMVWRLVCTPAFGLSAAVAVAGTLVHPCPRPLQRVPHVLALHGAVDASVPLDGSDQVVPLLGIATPSVRDVVAQVAAAARCGADGSGCAGGGSVRLTVVPGRGHPWEDLDATRRTAAFLSEVLPGVR